MRAEPTVRQVFPAKPTKSDPSLFLPSCDDWNMPLDEASVTEQRIMRLDPATVFDAACSAAKDMRSRFQCLELYTHLTSDKPMLTVMHAVMNEQLNLGIKRGRRRFDTPSGKTSDPKSYVIKCINRALGEMQMCFKTKGKDTPSGVMLDAAVKEAKRACDTVKTKTPAKLYDATRAALKKAGLTKYNDHINTILRFNGSASFPSVSHQEKQSIATHFLRLCGIFMKLGMPSRCGNYPYFIWRIAELVMPDKAWGFKPWKRTSRTELAASKTWKAVSAEFKSGF